MSILASAPQHHHDPVVAVRTGKLQRLVRRHEQLELLITARRSHGLPSDEEWLALVALEDQLADDYPQAAAHWERFWVTQEPVGAHSPGDQHTDCQICQHTALGNPSTLHLSTTVAW